jgi:hypothetical protein
MEGILMEVIIEAAGYKLNILYIALSCLGLHINFTVVKILLKSKKTTHHFYAITTSTILPFFHFYVFNFGRIPFWDIDLGNNIPLYYISFGLAWISSLPYIIARKLYS